MPIQSALAAILGDKSGPFIAIQLVKPSSFIGRQMVSWLQVLRASPDMNWQLAKVPAIWYRRITCVEGVVSGDYMRDHLGNVESYSSDHFYIESLVGLT